MSVNRRGQPPLTYRGVDTQPSIDWLEVSLPQTESEQLVTQTDLKEGEKSLYQVGFARSEARICFGGECRRSYEPHSVSKDWGTEYEGWRFTGSVAQAMADAVAALHSRPRRIDIAFDLFNTDWKPDDVYDALKVALPPRRCLGWYEEDRGRRQSLYVGSKQSDKRVVVYTKGAQLIESGVLIEVMPCDPDQWQRVELRLRNDQAVRWWTTYQVDPEAAYGAAAALIDDLTRRVVDVGDVARADLIEIPEPIKNDLSESARQLSLQWCTVLRYAEEAGIDVYAEARKHLATGASRMTVHRAKLAAEQGRRDRRIREASALVS